MKNLDPIILEHEQAKLKQLKLDHTAAVREYQLAMGKMQTAKSDADGYASQIAIYHRFSSSVSDRFIPGGIKMYNHLL